MREDKLPELKAENLLFFHPHPEFYWETLIPFFPLITLVKN